MRASFITSYENPPSALQPNLLCKPSQQLIQITNTNPGTDPSNVTFIVDNLAPAISGDGTQIVFFSNATSLDAANPNPNGNFEIYKAILPPGATAATNFKRLTNTGKNRDSESLRRLFGNIDPVISDDGGTIVFLSSRQNFNSVSGIPAFTANNPDNNAEIFVCNVTDTGGQCRQLTVSNPDDRPNPNLPGGVNYGVKLSGNGQMVAWVSDLNYDPARLNNDANEEIFIANLGNNTFRQVAQTFLSAPFGAVVPICNPASGTCSVDLSAGVNSIPVFNRPFSSDGRLFVFESAGNLDGANNTRTRNLFIFDQTTALRGGLPTRQSLPRLHRTN
jgi:WD40 repeat protein